MLRTWLGRRCAIVFITTDNIDDEVANELRKLETEFPEHFNHHSSLGIRLRNYNHDDVLQMLRTCLPTLVYSSKGVFMWLELNRPSQCLVAYDTYVLKRDNTTVAEIDCYSELISSVITQSYFKRRLQTRPSTYTTDYLKLSLSRAGWVGHGPPRCGPWSTDGKGSNGRLNQ